MTNTNAPDINGLDVQVLRVATLRPNVQIALANGGFVKKWMEDLAVNGAVIEATVDGAAVVVGQDGVQDKRFYIGAWLDDTSLIRVLTGMAKTCWYYNRANARGFAQTPHRVGRHAGEL